MLHKANKLALIGQFIDLPQYLKILNRKYFEYDYHDFFLGQN